MNKSHISILILLLLAVTGARSWADPGFAELRGEYAQALERIDAAEAKKLEELKTQYAKTLDKGVVYYMRKGDLKSTLALRDERERFEEEGTIPPEISGNGHKKAQKAQKAPEASHSTNEDPSTTGVSPVEQTDPDLQPVPWDDVDDGVIRTIKRCRQRWQGINQTANRQRLELNQYYAEQLEPVEKRLTREGWLDQALAVSKERERVAVEITRLDELVPEEEPEVGSQTSDLDPLERIPYELREHLVAYYTFDEPGTKVIDHSGNGHHGTVHGAKWVKDGKVGGCYEFDGEDDWIELGDPAAFRPGAFSIMLWVKPSAKDRNMVVLTNEPDAAAQEVGYGIRLREDKGAVWGVVGQQGRALLKVAEQDAIRSGDWMHLSLTYEGSVLRLYVNGVLRDSVEERNLTLNSRESLVIGRLSTREAGFFSGRIDDAAWFQTAISADSAARHFQRTKRAHSRPLP